MIVTYHPAARAEFRAAARRYEHERPGFGLVFVTAVRHAEAFIGTHPDAGAPLGANRRHLVRRFPYSLIYRHDGERLVILAVAHARRHPEYWLDRQ